MEKRRFNYLSPLLSKGLKFGILVSPMFASIAMAEKHSLSIGYNTSEYQYFDAYESTFKPDGGSLGYSYSFSDTWLLNLSYAQQTAKQRWRVSQGEIQGLLSAAEQDSNAYGLGFSWLGEDYSLSLSYSKQSNSEEALARIPAVIEVIDGDNQSLNFSYDSALTSETWEFGYGIGVQYLDSENLTRQTNLTDPILIATTNFDQTSWSVFTDLDLSYWVEGESFTWAPQLTVGWNWEISSDGEPLVLATRGGERRVVTRFSDRVLESFKTPDAGYWQIGAFFQWDSGWNLSVSTGNTISAEPEIQSTSIEIGVYF